MSLECPSEMSVMQLQRCREKYEADLNKQTHCCVLTHITAEHKAANRRVFDKLYEMQRDLIEVRGGKSFPSSASISYIGSVSKSDSFSQSSFSHQSDSHTTSSHRHQHGNEHYTSSEKHKSHHGKNKNLGHNDGSHAIIYPENLKLRSHRELKVILPIPDIHRISDCDTIYRFLIARQMNEMHCVSDILHYIAFREQYGLNTILWDREVESMYNGLDGEELLRSVIEMIAKKGSVKNVKIPRPLLQPGWGVWNCGVDKLGHVLLYQRVNPRELALLEKRWPYQENAYNKRAVDFDSTTLPYANLLIRLQLRINEKSRRLARLMNYNNQNILRDVCGIDTNADVMTTGVIPNAQKPPSNLSLSKTTIHTSNSNTNSNSNSNSNTHTSHTNAAETWIDNGGGVTWLVDVGAISVSHFTSSKYKEAFKVFRLVSMFGQSYYPENLFRLIIVNGGFTFKVLYKLVRPWLDVQTQKKIILLSATNKASIEELNVLDIATPISRESRSNDEKSSIGSNENEKSYSGSSTDHYDGNNINKEEKEEDDDDDDDDDKDDNENDNPTEDKNAVRNTTHAKTKHDKSNYALHTALLEYIDDRFLPSIYGGKLFSLPAPLGYGGAAPKYLTEKPFYNEAVGMIKRTVLPELLTDEFLFEHATEGSEVSFDEWNAFRSEMRFRM